jgi:hypothetical protein
MSYKDLKGGLLGLGNVSGSIGKAYSTVKNATYSVATGDVFRSQTMIDARNSIFNFKNFWIDYIKDTTYDFENSMLYFTKFTTGSFLSNKDDNNKFLINCAIFITKFTAKYKIIIISLNDVFKNLNLIARSKGDYESFTKIILNAMDEFNYKINNSLNNSLNNRYESLTVTGKDRVTEKTDGQNMSNQQYTIAQPVQPNGYGQSQYRQTDGQNFINTQYPITQYVQPQYGQSNQNIGGKRHRKNQTRRHTNRRKRSQRHH